MQLPNHLSGPVGEGFVPFAMLLVIALEGASTVKKGKAHTRLAQGIGVSSIIEIQRNPLVFTKNSLLERTGSREIPRAAILAPRRRSIVSSMPTTTGSVAGNKDLHEQEQQQTTDGSTRPGCAVEHAMIVLELFLGLQSHDSQDRCDRSVSWCQDRSDEKDFGPLPHSLAEDSLKGAQHLYNLSRQIHLLSSFF
jgi:hypothetical protein